MIGRWSFLVLVAAALFIGAGLLVGRNLLQPQHQERSTADGGAAGSSGASSRRDSRPDGAFAGREPILRQDGNAAYYADKYDGRVTASGERFDQADLTGASRVLPLGARATVINQENDKSVEVTINDRGPHVAGRVIDLSKAAAEKLDMTEAGVVPVRVEARPSRQPTAELGEKILQEAEAQARDGR